MPTSGRALDQVAFSATVHCLTGCAIGEIAGMAIGTAVGLSNGSTVALSIALAFFFGYGLTSLPLLRSGMALGAVVAVALASDTISIAIMEIVDNAIMLLIPGAMEATLDDIGFYAALTAALIMLIDKATPNWVAALIVAAVYAAIAGILALQGRNKVKEAVPPVPEQATESVKEDVQWAKTRMQSARR